MARETGNPHGFSDRMRDAIDVVSACGDPKTAPETNTKEAAWGEDDGDHHSFPRTGDPRGSTHDEIVDYYAQHQVGGKGGDEFRILK